MELNLHINVFMGGMFLSACGGVGRARWVQEQRQHVAVRGRETGPGTLREWLQRKSRAIRGFQCLVRGKTNFPLAAQINGLLKQELKGPAKASCHLFYGKCAVWLQQGVVGFAIVC